MHWYGTLSVERLSVDWTFQLNLSPSDMSYILYVFVKTIICTLYPAYLTFKTLKDEKEKVLNNKNYYVVHSK